MTSLKTYGERFMSPTPTALKNLQKIFVGIAAGVVAAVTYITQNEINAPTVVLVLKYIGIAVAFAVPVLQFATTEEELMNK